ncbi:DUF7133 domain-containing protein [Thalassotalea sp. PLHSN55]|uniref:DUF7133 domain-containing protein n=1 Tax=Thalassotalea sp. PLHSN55 TaxID=3435888 RepID=UPI003F82AF41
MKILTSLLALPLTLGLLFGLALSPIAHAEKNPWLDYYDIEKVEYPKTLDPQISGLSALKDGSIALTTISGDVVLYQPKNKTWTTFATGLDQPLGIVQDSKNSFVVMQKPELTRLVDKNNDGKADLYQTLYNGFGMTGNYHEFAFGPVVDSKGNYYISLNIASNFNGINQYIRGEYSDMCPPEDQMRQWHDFKKWMAGYRKQVTRMFSCVPFRGWVMKISPDGSAEPYASGFRSPAGMHIDPLDKLWVTDNQGDWIGTSPLHQINQGDFAGHPASLHWLKGWKIKHKDVTTNDLLNIRKPSAGLFPQGELANSPTQPLSTIKPELFGLPEGELIIGDMNINNLIRFLPDPIEGVMQGTLIPFISGDELGIGNFRLDFSSDGSLWIGKVHLGWAGDEGLLKITKKPNDIFIVNKVKLLPDGFEIRFNNALTNVPTEINITRHGYHYHAKYGSEKVGLQKVKVKNIHLDKDKKSIKVITEKLITGQLYTLTLNDVNDNKNQPLMGKVLRYNVNKLLQSTEFKGANTHD